MKRRGHAPVARRRWWVMAAAFVWALACWTTLGCEKNRSSDRSPPAQETPVVATKPTSDPELSEGEWGVVVTAPACVSLDAKTGAVTSLALRGRYRLKMDCESLAARRHPEYGLDGWVFVEDVETRESVSNSLDADEGGVIEPDPDGPQEPSCEELAGMSVGGKIAVDVTDLVDLPKRPTTLSIHVAYGTLRSNTVRVRVVGHDERCDTPSP